MKVISVAEIDRKIVGCSHGFYLKLKMGEKSLLAQQGTDLAVHEDFRDMGIFKKLIDLKNKHQSENKTNITCAISTNPIVFKTDLKKNRPQFPSPVRHLIKIRDVDQHLKMVNSQNKSMKKYGYKWLEALNQFKNFMISSDYHSRSTPDFEISQIKKFDEQIETFWNEIKQNYSFIIERDSNYLNWRYCDKRGGDYLIKQASEKGTVLGYIVLRINMYKKDYPEGYIVDLLTLPNRLDVADALILDADNYFIEQDVNIIHTLSIKGHPYERSFERNNFLSDRARYYVFYTPLNVGNELNDFITAPPSRLHFEYGDLDWI